MTTVITITMRTIQSGKIRVSANIYLLYINFLLYCYHLLLGRSQEERDGGKTHCLAILEIRKIAIRSEIYDKAAEDQKSWFLAALLPVMLGSWCYSRCDKRPLICHFSWTSDDKEQTVLHPQLLNLHWRGEGEWREHFFFSSLLLMCTHYDRITESLGLE